MAAAVLPALRPTPPPSKLPALLPTPPRSQMLPLLPTPCLIILPASFRAPPASGPKPGRADAVERWDARKKASCSAASSSSSSSSSGFPCRADSCERWDAHKNKKAGAASSSKASGGISPGRANSCERWDAHKTPGSPASSTGSSRNPCRVDSVERWDSNKRPLSRASSAERWDMNKKPRPKKGAVGSGKSNSTSQTTTMVKPPQPFSHFSDYHHMALELHCILEGYIDISTGRPANPAVHGENAFLTRVVMPIYGVIRAEVESSRNGTAPHSAWRNYIDINDHGGSGSPCAAPDAAGEQVASAATHPAEELDAALLLTSCLIILPASFRAPSTSGPKPS
uniref:1,3-beta-glucan synthase component FKS1-like domain-containing protein n=1 Tax=Oryza punctata TaxID=4537 RepID=A0A0E0LVD4_ORYPU